MDNQLEMGASGASIQGVNPSNLGITQSEVEEVKTKSEHGLEKSKSQISHRKSRSKTNLGIMLKNTQKAYFEDYPNPNPNKSSNNNNSKR
jgi:hypothetical protein